MTFSQSNFDIRCEWGLHGAIKLAQCCDAVIIVDVLSFTTAVTIAVSNGGVVFPYPWKDNSREEFAKSHGAILAGPRSSGNYSLSPSSLIEVQQGERIVLPSPNGSTISLATDDTPTYAGCLRNAKAVAKAAQRHGTTIGVVPCGERWKSDATLRPAIEDWLGAGAIIQHLAGTLSSEALLAQANYQYAQTQLLSIIKQSSSGRELLEMGFEYDINLACEENVSDITPKLVNDAYTICH